MAVGSATEFKPLRQKKLQKREHIMEDSNRRTRIDARSTKNKPLAGGLGQASNRLGAALEAPLSLRGSLNGEQALERDASGIMCREDQQAVSASPPLTSEQAPRILVTLATFNEAGNLKALVETIREVEPSAEILVIDDNSPDGTGRIADELVASLPAIHVIHRPAKLGLGTATIAAMRFAIENGYDYLLNLDADFSHPPSFIPSILAGMRDHDVMIGSRYVPGGGVEGGFTFKRKFMSSGINSYARLFLGLTSKDNSGAFRCYRVSKLAEIDFSRIRSRGYSFQEEILFWCASVGCRIGETPILFMNRRSGISKINKKEAVDALLIIMQLGVGRWIGRP
jgi:dolichol-phosphate mannosyltransferase